MNEFLAQLAAILEVESIAPDAPLKSFPLLDSLGILSIIAMLDTRYGVNLNTAEILQMATPEDLWNHVRRIKQKTETLAS